MTIKPPKQKRCKICKKMFPPQNSLQVVCSLPCAIELANKSNTKERRIAQAELKREKVATNHAKQVSLTQTAFNKMRRLEEFEWFRSRGMEPTCISCGKELGGDQWCCGHFKTTGAQGNLRFDRKNTYLQHNVRCNRGLSGDIGGTKTTRGYKAGLLERFGEEEGNKIIEYCETHIEKQKLTCEQLIDMRKEFNKRIRHMIRLAE